MAKLDVKKTAKRMVKAALAGETSRIALRDVVAADRVNYAELVAEVMRVVDRYAARGQRVQLVA